MVDETHALLDRSATDCSLCRRSVLVGEPLSPFVDPRSDRLASVCELCRPRARARGWTQDGEPIRRRDGKRLRIEPQVADRPTKMTAPQVAILERAIGLEARPVDPQPSPAILERVRRQDLELQQLRRELNPARRAEEHRRMDRQLAEIRTLRAQLSERDRRIEQLQRARHAETSPMRMSGCALDAFNQSSDLERMARIARTLGEPTVNVHDEGPGIPRRVRLTLSWDIAWYEFTVKLDLGEGRASVHETGTGGDSTVLPLERRRANALWSGSGLKLS